MKSDLRVVPRKPRVVKALSTPQSRETTQTVQVKLVEEKAPQVALPFQGTFTIAKSTCTRNVQKTRISPLPVAYSNCYENASFANGKSPQWIQRK